MFRTSRSQPPTSTPASATSSLSQPSGATCLLLGKFGACGARMVYPVRGITSLSALSEGNEEEGGGDHDTREAAGGSPAADEIRAVQDEIRAVELRIEDVVEETKKVAKKIDDVEAAIDGGSGYLGMTDPEALLKERDQLRREKEQLRRENEQIRRKEEQLLELLLKKEDRLSRIEQLRANNTPAGAAFQPAGKADESVTGFGTELIRAVETNSTLELVSGTFFLGDSEQGSKIYIRPFYKQLAQLIFSGAKSGEMRNTVVTGTPGIGKSTFSFYLLYLLRREGKTVVYDFKNEWFRFSDEGVVQGTRDDFFKAGYMRGDTEAWHLSDPEWKPYATFGGVTVVFVSPEQDRVKRFLKERKKSRQLFMPVWGMNELLECREAVYPEISVVDMKEAFDRVGGVARAVFDAVELRQHMGYMNSAANEMRLDSLQALLSHVRGNIEYFSIDGISDALLHMVPIPGTNFEYFDFNFASDYARNLTVKSASRKGST